MKNVYLAVFAMHIVASSLAAKTGVSVTIYNENLALVRDTRELQFKQGRGAVSFQDVSAQIDATSVHFSANGVEMLEQNFDYDLVSPDKLLQKYVDQEIEVVDESGNATRGTLLSFGTGSSGAQIVLRLPDGALRSLLTDKATDIRYPSLPEGLITKPTLNWLVESESGGSKETEIAYLTGGLSWRADYVLLLNQANDHGDLDAWVTLNNHCGTSFKEAQLKLIAGEPNRVRQERAFAVDGLARADVAMMKSAAPQFKEESFFEYHLYTLQRPATILNNQTKQVSLFPSTSLALKKLYEFDPQRDNDNVGVSVEFENKKSNGLGMPIPAGLVRVYQRSSDGGEEFIGEDRVKHTPPDEKLRVKVGKVFDVAVERTQRDYRRITDRVSETDWEVKLRNRKKESIEVVVVDYSWGDWEVTRSSLAAKKVSANKVEFTVPCEPDTEVLLTYTIRNR